MCSRRPELSFSLLVFLMSVYFLPYAPAPALADDLNNVVPNKDTWVSSNSTSSNFGSNTTIFLGDLPGTAAIFLQYDVSAIPSGSVVNSATLSFQKAFTNHSGGMAVSLRRRSGSWSEGSVTWANSSPLSDAIVGSATINTGLSFPLITASALTTLVQEWVDSSSDNRGLAIVPGAATGTYISFHSKEGSGNPIRLSVNYTPPSRTLTVTGSGSGSGTVTASGINCSIGGGAASGDCSQSYSLGTVVTLSPSASTGSTFTGWSGDSDCSDGQVTMSANRTCTANFALNQYALTVTGAGTGSGTVTASGISCTITAGSASGDCGQAYSSGTAVALTPSPAAGSTFGGWSGNADCSDGLVTMNAAKTCTATFNVGQATLTITGAGTGSGTVTASGISCTITAGSASGDCSQAYSSGTVVTLTPSPAAGSTFGGWSGNADCSDGLVTMNAAKTCTATFVDDSGPLECAHSKLQTGEALDADCDSCVGQICAIDPFCCSTSWDSVCVQEVYSVCGLVFADGFEQGTVDGWSFSEP